MGVSKLVPKSPGIQPGLFGFDKKITKYYFAIINL